jgi:hypothetical protein
MQDTQVVGREFDNDNWTLQMQFDKEKKDGFSILKKSPTLPLSTPSQASVKSDDMSRRALGVVARLMGLESLPGRTFVFVSELCHITSPSQYSHGTTTS